MISDQQLQTVKAVPIVSYLQSIGHNPVKQTGRQLLYFSPMRDEQTPSFWVSPDKNVFKDFGGEDGDIIRLVRNLTGCSFREAVDTLLRFDGATLDPNPATFSFSGQNTPQSDGQTGLIVTEVKPLENAALWQYVKGRGISAPVAQKYLKQVHFNTPQRSGQYAVGFGNDGGGYALRNKIWKSAVSPNGITTIEGQNTTTLNLFEGFFDFLSACESFGFTQPRNTTIVLNSLSHLPSVSERTKSAKVVNLYFDNDPAGKAATRKLITEHGQGKVYDRSTLYKKHKDFNTYWALRKE